MSAEFTNIQIHPEFSAWTTSFGKACENSRLSELRQSARVRLLGAAEQFTLRLSSIAEEADLPALRQEILTGDPDEVPIVMTGHQPVVFHSGITFKYSVTERFAAAEKAICVAVVIDTDHGDAGQFSYPESDPDSDRPTLAIETLSAANNLYLNGKLRNAGELEAVSNTVVQQLRRFGHDNAAAVTKDVLRSYGLLSAARVSAMDANVIMRWQRGIGGRMLELPLSAIASFPEALKLTADILKQPMRFAAAYNAALEVYREENGIRNPANPFPNLKTDEQSCELPFWVISHNRGKRYALEAQVDGNVTRLLADDKPLDSLTGNISAESLEPMLVQNIQIVPRGALITTFLRLLFSDLFVHGTGGARYDRFTDEFIRSWWNVEPPPFTVATASRYLFENQRTELQKLEEIKTSLRDLQFNPQRHFGAGVFKAEFESRLSELTQQKESVVARLKESQSKGESAKELGMTIQQITNQIRDAVTAEFESQISALNSVTPEQKDAVRCRTFPWFMFS